MKFKSIYTLLLPLLVIGFGCKKQVDLLPTDAILSDQAFLTVTHLQNGLNRAYDSYNGENTSYINAILSDEVTLGRDWAGQGQFAFRWQHGSDGTTGGDVIAGWGSFYNTIMNCNIVLANIDKVTGANASEEALKVSIRAQAIALRALAHFELLQRYAKGPYDPTSPGIPIITTYVDPSSAPKPSRNTSQEVVTMIQSDLKTASSLMPASTPFSDVTLNKLNITGLQARVALYKRDWKMAIDSSSAVISSGMRPLDPANFAGIWTDAALNSEVLFRTKRSTAGSSVDGYYTTTTNAVYFNPSAKLRASYLAGDARVAPYIGSIYVNKYFASAMFGGRINDTKHMRISEMYLIRAEANIEFTQSPTAGTADLTTLRTARNTSAAPVFTTVSDAIDFVLDERFRELPFEGFRFFDLKRRGKPIVRNIADVQSTAWQVLQANDYHFTLPIPATELQANNNISQNPNY